MSFGEYIRMALHSLKANKMRSFLTMLGIIIGIAAVISILTVGNSITANVSVMMQGLGANDIFVAVQQRDGSDLDEAEDIEKLATDGLRFGHPAAAEMKDSDYITTDMILGMCEKFPDEVYAVNINHRLGNGKLIYEGESEKVSVIGTSVGFFLTNSVNMEAGSMFSSSDFENGRNTCLIPLRVAKTLFGDDPFDAIGKEIDVSLEGGEMLLTVIGVYTSDGQNGMMMSFGMSFNKVYVPLRTAMTFDHTEGRYSYFQVSTKTDVNPDILKSRIKSYFEPYYRNNKGFKVSVVTYDSLLSMLYRMLDLITLAISVIAGIALVVGGIGVMNIMLVSVTERTREIGTRKALGAKNSAIRSQFLVEAVIICLIGGIIGVILGIVFGAIITSFLDYPAMPSVFGILLSLGFSSAVGLTFGYAPASKAAKLNPIEALRYE